MRNHNYVWPNNTDMQSEDGLLWRSLLLVVLLLINFLWKIMILCGFFPFLPLLSLVPS